jgi:hypothetical protein
VVDDIPSLGTTGATLNVFVPVVTVWFVVKSINPELNPVIFAPLIIGAFVPKSIVCGDDATNPPVNVCCAVKVFVAFSRATFPDK